MPRINPERDMTLMESPSMYMRAKVNITDAGMQVATTRDVRKSGRRTAMRNTPKATKVTGQAVDSMDQRKT